MAGQSSNLTLAVSWKAAPWARQRKRCQATPSSGWVPDHARCPRHRHWTYLPAVPAPGAQPQALQAGDPGAGQPATVDGPFDNDTIACTWDAAGRSLCTTLDGTTLSDDPNAGGALS